LRKSSQTSLACHDKNIIITQLFPTKPSIVVPAYCLPYKQKTQTKLQLVSNEEEISHKVSLAYHLQVMLCLFSAFILSFD